MITKNLHMESHLSSDEVLGQFIFYCLWENSNQFNLQPVFFNSVLGETIWPEGLDAYNLICVGSSDVCFDVYRRRFQSSQIAKVEAEEWQATF
jgi:hypothetical protein